MTSDIVLNTDALHHTYFLFGYSIDDARDAFMHACNLSVGSPDVVEYIYDTFGIDDARALIARARIKPLGARALYLTRTHALTTEAGQALLKILEEPPRGVHMVFMLPRTYVLLDTLRSRGVSLYAHEKTQDIETFFKSTPGKRIAYIEKLIKKEDGESIEQFLNAVELHCARDVKKYHEALEHLVDVREALALRGTSKKQLLESVALLIV